MKAVLLGSRPYKNPGPPRWGLCMWGQHLLHVKQWLLEMLNKGMFNCWAGQNSYRIVACSMYEYCLNVRICCLNTYFSLFKYKRLFRKQQPLRMQLFLLTNWALIMWQRKSSSLLVTFSSFNHIAIMLFLAVRKVYTHSCICTWWMLFHAQYLQNMFSSDRIFQN